MRQLVLQGLPTTRTRTSFGGVFLQSLALAGEDFAVDREQIFALHARFAGDAADEQGPMDIAEAFVQIGGGDELVQRRVGAVLQFHDHALQGGQGVGDIHQGEDDGLIGPKSSPEAMRNRME